MNRQATWLPLTAAVVLAALYLIMAPHTADLAAQTARGTLFRRTGYVPYWAGWYSGIPTASYSLVTPPLLGWVHPVLLGAVSVVGTTALALPLLDGVERPALGGLAVAVAAALDVFSGRTTFAVGVVVLVGGLVAVQRRSAVLAGGLALLCTVTSPVAGFLFAVVCAGVAIADSGRRRVAMVGVTGVGVALGGLAVLSRGDGAGQQPFSVSSLLMAAGTAAVVAIAVRDRLVRVVAVVVILMLVAVFAVPSGVGSNATRLAVLASAPVVIARCRWPRRALVVAGALAVALPASQLTNDVRAASHHDGTASFTAGLQRELSGMPSARTHRLELVDTATHWPSAHLTSTVVLARGWERQVDIMRNPELYAGPPLTDTTYRDFLDHNAVGLIAVPRGVPLDYGSTREQQLIASGLPYLTIVWQDQHWMLFAVRQPASVVSAPGSVIGLSQTGAELDLPRPGSYLVRLRWSPYLHVIGGRVSRSPDGVEVSVSRPGRYRLAAHWSFP